jgi:iron-sulfur cluster assembly accessory protein
MATEVASPAHEENRPSDQATLSLTEKAVAQVRSILEREKIEGHGLRVSVVGGGCSGFSYGLDFESEKRPEDVVLEVDGITIYLDPASAKYLKGTVLDYVSGLYGAGFKFTNPNVSATCGCGTSFSV